MYFNEYSWPFIAFSWFFMVLFWFLIIVWVVYFIKLSSNSNNDNSKYNENKALNILKERYAKWEIDKKEFDDMKINLGK